MTLDQPTNRLKLKTVDINSFAFYQGAQGIPLKETVNEIEAQSQQAKVRLKEKSIQIQKPIEASAERCEHLRLRVDHAWTGVQDRLGSHAPSVFTAFVVVALGSAALVVDSILLGPGLDAINITDPTLQYVAAFGLACLSSLVFHLAHETFSDPRIGFETRIIWRVLGGFAAVSLLGWGMLRGFQVGFAADLNQNPLGRFLSEHPVLSSIFFCFITLAAPLVGAAAITYAAPRIVDSHAWKRAKAEHDSLYAKLIEARKKLESERESLDHRLQQLDARCQEWISAATQYHERGARHGARQVPHWLVILKATLWSVVGLVLGCVLGQFLAALYFALPLGAWVMGFLYHRHRRFHPSYNQFKRQENTRFVVGSDRALIDQRTTPRLLSAPREEPR